MLLGREHILQGGFKHAEKTDGGGARRRIDAGPIAWGGDEGLAQDVGGSGVGTNREEVGAAEIAAGNDGGVSGGDARAVLRSLGEGEFADPNGPIETEVRT